MIKANLRTSACPFSCSRLSKRIWRAVCALHDTPIHVRNEIFFVIEDLDLLLLTLLLRNRLKIFNIFRSFYRSLLCIYLSNR